MYKVVKIATLNNTLLNQKNITHTFVRVTALTILYFIALYYLNKYTGSWDVLNVLLIFGAIFIGIGIILLVEALSLHKKKAIAKRNINLILIVIFTLAIAFTLGS
jgi:hypothetical protein